MKRYFLAVISSGGSMWNNVTGAMVGPYSGGNFCLAPPSVIQNPSYGKVGIVATAMITGLSCVVKGVKSFLSEPDGESFAEQRRRSVRACAYLYSGVATVAFSVLFYAVL